MEPPFESCRGAVRINDLIYRRLHEASYEIFFQRDQQRGTAESLLGIDRACLGLGELPQCKDVLQRAQATFEELHDHRRVAECQELLALLYARQKQFSESAELLKKAEMLRMRISSPLPPLDAEKIQKLRSEIAGVIGFS